MVEIHIEPFNAKRYTLEVKDVSPLDGRLETLEFRITVSKDTLLKLIADSIGRYGAERVYGACVYIVYHLNLPKAKMRKEPLKADLERIIESAKAEYSGGDGGRFYIRLDYLYDGTGTKKPHNKTPYVKYKLRGEASKRLARV